MGFKRRAKHAWAGWWRLPEREVVLCAVKGSLDPAAMRDATQCGFVVTGRIATEFGAPSTLRRKGHLLCQGCVRRLTVDKRRSVADHGGATQTE